MGNSINKIRLKNSSGTESLYDIMLGVNITQAEYNALTPAQKATGTYWIQDAETEAELAKNIDYDNGESGLESTTVQAAIDEVDDNLDTVKSNLSGLFTLDGTTLTIHTSLLQ